MVRRIILASLVLMGLIALTDGVAQSGWVDDWITQRTETSPGYFEGQKRGYFSGGGFSARWYNSNDYLASLTPPRVKTGCGGIDMFAGAISFLDFNHLVQKLQTMLTNAPAVAFDLAFNTLCEPCAKSIKSFEAITDTLNQLQFSDCQASQVLVAKTFEGLGSENAKVRAMAESDFVMTSGLQNLRQNLTNIWSTTGNQPTVNDSAQIAGCPAAIKDIFATPGKTVLQAIADKKSYPAAYIDLARGFTGDVLLTQATSSNGTLQIAPVLIPPCEQNKPEAIDNFFSGQAYQRPADGSACTLITDANANLSQWAGNQLQGILSKMQSGTALLPQETDFLNTLPIPAYGALKMAASSEQGGSIIAILSEIGARAYAYSMMADLYQLALQGVTTAQSVVSAQGQQTLANCEMDLIELAIKETETLAHQIQASIGQIQRSYATMAGEVNTIMEASARFEQFNQIARASLAKVFRPSIVNRSMGSR